MFAKLEITGILEVLTGMHIGGSSAFAAIGAVDSPVIRDTLSDMPMIPGSSLKGKLRTLLAQQYNGKPVSTYDDDDPRILRLFGSARKNAVKRSRLLFRDMQLNNMDELRGQGLHSATEVKFENNIIRLTAVANPRQIERVIRGAEFALSIVYDMHDVQPDEVLEDMSLLAEGMRLLQYDYLGGHGSRGYGKVQFENLKVQPAVGSIAPDLVQKCMAAFEGV